MSKAWIQAKLPEFVRDMFRYFCQSCRYLEEQFDSYSKSGVMDFNQLQELIGKDSYKGILWRLKDTAHHVFRNDPDDPLEGRFLDWGLGYIFHESIKLKEDSYQQLNYAPWLKDMDGVLARAKRDIAGPLSHVPMQTEESMRREIDRIKIILAQCKRILPDYLVRHSNNQLLARFIFTQNDLVREVFGEVYQELVDGIYLDQQELMFILAAQSLRLGGWVDEAQAAVKAAYDLNPESKIVLQEKKIIDNWLTRITP
ncbi:MAG: hypothetical protein KKC99_02820 [Proteobacteria bacterium]|nr:hypothetical protein [Pseudomonadota bacterium]